MQAPHQNPVNNLALLSKLYKQAYFDQTDNVIRIINDYLFYQNPHCQFLIGKAVALQKNHIDWQNYPLDSGKIGLDKRHLFPYFPYLSAARRLSNMKCYCCGNEPQCKSNCKTLVAIFDCKETEIKNCINEVLIATYNTCEDHIIEAIREDARKRDEAAKKEKEEKEKEEKEREKRQDEEEILLNKILEDASKIPNRRLRRSRRIKTKVKDDN
jgi:hypothetical protein